MARRKPRRSRRFDLRKVHMNTTVSVGALAAADVVESSITAQSTNAYRLISVDFSYGLSDLGATSDDGQVFGLSHSDYTAAEIEECLESQGAIDIGSKIEQEQANRLVRQIGQMVGAPGTGAGLNFNDGMPVKTKLNWYMGIGDQLALWIRNTSGTVYTTGATIDISGVFWVKDPK